MRVLLHVHNACTPRCRWAGPGFTATSLTYRFNEPFYPTFVTLHILSCQVWSAHAGQPKTMSRQQRPHRLGRPAHGQRPRVGHIQSTPLAGPGPQDKVLAKIAFVGAVGSKFARTPVTCISNSWSNVCLPT